MPSIARKVNITARKDGLVLQPLASKGQRQTPPVRISYKNSAVGPVLSNANNDGNGDGKSFEAFGIVGLLTVAQTSYLISITRREQVAQLHNHPIYVVTDVALTPLASQKDAEASVVSTHTSLSRNATSEQEDEGNNSDDEAVLSGLGSDDVEDEEISTITPPPEKRLHKRSTSVVNDVFAKKGGYGRFARNWFNRNGWAPDRKMAGVGLSSAGVDAESDAQISTTPATPVISAADNKSETNSTEVDGEESGLTDEHVAALLPKLLRTTSLLFGSSRSFYFAYDYDITRSVSNSRSENGSDLPLHEEVDPLFFWNRNVIQPFIDAGQYSLVLPLMQGFVGQRSFSIERYPVAKLPGAGGEILELRDMHPNEERIARAISDRPTTPKYVESDCDDTPGDKNSSDLSPISGHDPRALAFEPSSTYLLTLISRRSVKRAGLRYLRRGIDEDGHCANSVETEQILSTPTWTTSPIYSFVQIRGSIPVFFSQSPYSFKPVPQMQNSEGTNFEAFKKHFETLTERYGDITITNLVEKHDNEGIVGDAYEKYWKRLIEEGGVNGQKPLFEWFDFHSVCRGMKFENVSLLLDSLSPSLEKFGYTISREGNAKTRQSGVLRTNCMDCLDRTNIVQSAVARQVLEQQLKAEGFDMSAQLDQTTQWFNVLWADNGDAVSKQYASTAAMKGDYTRTRKRDYRGALTDMGLSISRFYSGIVNDYFSQATIDFLVGSVSALIFEDFGTNLMTADPSVSLSRTRQRGIEISHKLVVADASEELLGGWAFLTPHEANSVKGHMEESVLLLTDAALYACRFDWNMEKVESFERVDLRHVTGVKWGPYVTATLTRAQCDEKKNVGMVVKYRAGADDITRVNTRSLSTVASREVLDGVAAADAAPDKENPVGDRGRKPGEERIIALKALQARTSVVGDGGSSAAPVSEEELIRSVAEEIGRVVGIEGRVEKGDIIGVGEAKRATGLLDLIGWRVKRLVWA
ncbi:hypothetical protein VE01_01341 [Pseudogymnoascus verrucosus]|uniref:SAC domain-containing protein n=1 Tax=Pseudogymnoascus verrucosus TaxID=342668 RepID=A0A1B8GXY2_9PEZI|nr:uncharacterized protein VE01_01341 [Pseudogymnoascus verrucosus]OBU00667.1 hypothetical protein VE01_01341 [Pseudogymnoascus verrucosus]